MAMRSNIKLPGLNSTGWKSIPNMMENRRGAAAVAIDSDRILVVGGHDGRDYLSSCEIYDRRNDSWDMINGPMISHHTHIKDYRSCCGSSAVSLLGQVYIVGGDGGHTSCARTMSVFNLTTHEWGSSIIMKTKRNCCGAVGFRKSIFMFGGEHSNNKVEKFNIDTKVWKTLPPMPRKRNDCCAVLIKKKIYLMGGNHTAVDIFDLDSMTWDKNDNSPERMSMIRIGCCAVPFRHYILVIGGQDDSGTCLNSAELFDTESKRWAILSIQMNYQRWTSAAAVVNNSHVVVVGGYAGSQTLNTAEKANVTNLITTATFQQRSLQGLDSFRSSSNAQLSILPSVAKANTGPALQARDRVFLGEFLAQENIDKTLATESVLAELISRRGKLDAAIKALQDLP